jgi:hypothetical protein
MKRSHGSLSRSRGIVVVVSTMARSTGCRTNAGEVTIVARTSLTSASVSALVVCVTYQRSRRLTTETITPSVASASVSAVAARSDNRPEPCVYQSTAWESARTFTLRTGPAGRARWRAGSPPSSRLRGPAASPRCCRSIRSQASPRHEGACQGLHPGFLAGRQECSRPGLRPARGRRVRSLPSADFSAPNREGTPWLEPWPVELQRMKGTRT